MGLFDPSWSEDPTSPEYQRRLKAVSVEGPAYQTAFKGAEQATFGALGASGEVGKEQADLARALRAQAEGKAPSLAAMQYAQALNQSQAAAASQLASSRGLSPAQAQQMLMTRQAAAQQQAAGQSAMMRLQEQQMAQAALGNLLGQRRQQELLGGQLAAGLYGTAGGLGMSEAQMRQQAAMAVQQQANLEAQRNAQLVGSLVGAAGTLGGAYFTGGASAAMPAATPAAAASFAGTSNMTGLSPEAQSILQGGRARGGAIEVPGKAKYKGDTRANDTVPALLSPGEIVLPRTVAQSDDAPDKAKKFVEAIKTKKKPSARDYAQALARLQELESRMNAMEALADLEAEDEG
jgi:hypothetical protein